MNVTQSFRLAINSLLTSKMRALLTMLGIIIGVAAVIIIISLGNGLQNYLNAQFEQMGVNIIQVQIMGRGTGNRSVDTDDMYRLTEKYPQYLSGVSPYVSVQAEVRSGGTSYDRTSVYGVSDIYYNRERNQTMRGEALSEGRFLSYIDVERYQNVCVIGRYLDQVIFQGDSLDRTLTIGGVPYTVIGVLEQKADCTEGSGDDVIFLPHSCAQRLNNQMANGAGAISIMGASAIVYLFTSTGQETSSAAKGVIERLLDQVYQSSDSYIVVTAAEMMDTMNSMLEVLMTILVVIAAISLLVGGIGIMNIMLVSVTERTREIGIRKSLGAKGRDIRSQFIIEAGTTSAVGGTIGIVLGVVLANAATVIVGAVMGGSDGFTATPSLVGILVSFGVSVGVGVLFGYLPANKAAKLNPIDALRYD